MRLCKPKRLRAGEHNEQRGRELARQGLADQAIAAYRLAAEIDPRRSVPFYNLDLVCKYGR